MNIVQWQTELNRWKKDELIEHIIFNKLSDNIKKRGQILVKSKKSPQGS